MTCLDSSIIGFTNSRLLSDYGTYRQLFGVNLRNSGARCLEIIHPRVAFTLSVGLIGGLSRTGTPATGNPGGRSWNNYGINNNEERVCGTGRMQLVEKGVWGKWLISNLLEGVYRRPGE